MAIRVLISFLLSLSIVFADSASLKGKKVPSLTSIGAVYIESTEGLRELAENQATRNIAYPCPNNESRICIEYMGYPKDWGFGSLSGAEFQISKDDCELVEINSLSMSEVQDFSRIATMIADVEVARKKNLELEKTRTKEAAEELPALLKTRDSVVSAYAKLVGTIPEFKSKMEKDRGKLDGEKNRRILYATRKDKFTSYKYFHEAFKEMPKENVARMLSQTILKRDLFPVYERRQRLLRSFVKLPDDIRSAIDRNPSSQELEQMILSRLDQKQLNEQAARALDWAEERLRSTQGGYITAVARTKDLPKRLKEVNDIGDRRVKALREGTFHLYSGTPGRLPGGRRNPYILPAKVSPYDPLAVEFSDSAIGKLKDFLNGRIPAAKNRFGQSLVPEEREVSTWLKTLPGYADITDSRSGDAVGRLIFGKEEADLLEDEFRHWADTLTRFFEDVRIQLNCPPLYLPSVGSNDSSRPLGSNDSVVKEAK